ncbi:hypothetical protein MPER_02990 [Moniliophthora perniciosa FA553]|nr:hypothetical protein MPER_02990 [Moniliophthora perniciosa FA553]
MLGQEDHQAVLRDILSKEYNCHVELSTELVSFTSHPDHVVTQIQKSGSPVEEARFDWLIGTDGAHSVVRKQLGLAFLGETVEANTMAIGDIEVLEGFDSSSWNVWGSAADKMQAHAYLFPRTLSMRPYTRRNKNYHWFIIGGKNIDVVKAASDREVLLNYIHETIGKKKYEYGELRASAPWK